MDQSAMKATVPYSIASIARMQKQYSVGVATWRYGGGLQAKGRRGVCLKSSGALEAGCRRRDVEAFASRALEARCSVETSRCGGMEAGCRRAEVEVFASRAPELWRRAVGAGTWRCFASRALEACRRFSDVEVWRYGGGLQACRRGGIEVSRYGDALQACRCRGMEVVGRSRACA